MIRRPPRSTPKPSSAASDVYKRQYQCSVVCQNPGSKCPTRGLKIILRESEGTRKFSKFGASGTRLVPEWHQTRGSTSLSPRSPWWHKPGRGYPWLRTHGWAPIAAQPRPAPDAPRRPAPFPLSIVSRFFSRVGPRRVPCASVAHLFCAPCVRRVHLGSRHAVHASEVSLAATPPMQIMHAPGFRIL